MTEEKTRSRFLFPKSKVCVGDTDDSKIKCTVQEEILVIFTESYPEEISFDSYRQQL